MKTHFGPEPPKSKTKKSKVKKAEKPKVKK
jgi:hypothetical protein